MEIIKFGLVFAGLLALCSAAAVPGPAPVAVPQAKASAVELLDGSAAIEGDLQASSSYGIGSYGGGYGYGGYGGYGYGGHHGGYYGGHGHSYYPTYSTYSYYPSYGYGYGYGYPHYSGGLYGGHY